MDYRKEIINELIPYFEKDDRYHLACLDSGFGTIDQFIDKFPTRFTNGGIMEQGIVGICAGLAMTGKIPIIFTICNFLCFRALEQIRNDVLLHKLNVKFIGTGAENYFDFLGPSHTCDQDDKKIFDIIGLEVFDPYEGIKELLEKKQDKFFKDNKDKLSWDKYYAYDLSECEPSEEEAREWFKNFVGDFMLSEKAGYIRV